MKKTISWVVLLILTLIAFVSGAIATAPPKPATTSAPAAPAATKPASPVNLEKFTGDIKTVDATAKSFVVTKGKEEKTFWVDENTKITKGKEALTFADLKAGMNVSLEYKKDGDKMIAATIKASAPKAPKK